jgi:putative (di)nucleoside polyphosphate hydrolase
VATLRLKTKDEKYRRGVGIMLLNRFGEVFVAQRIDLPEEAWQMPQGGIDDSEDPREAALRELKEEIGTNKADFIDESKGWFHYDFPEEIRQRSRNGQWLGQRQKWFVMRFKGEDADIDLNTEHPEFVAWKWINVRELPGLVVSFKRQVYVDVLGEFAELTRSLEERIFELVREPLVQLAMAADSVDENELFELLRRASMDLRQRNSS